MSRCREGHCRRSRSRNRRWWKGLEFEEVCLLCLNHAAEVGIVGIEILACLLSCHEIVKKKIFVKINDEFEFV